MFVADSCRSEPLKNIYEIAVIRKLRLPFNGIFTFMEKIVCKKCGAEDDYSTQLKNRQNVATCNNCHSFIKNISYSQPKFYFGQYKGNLIADCVDLSYLEWFLANTNPKANIKTACVNRIEILKSTQHGNI